MSRAALALLVVAALVGCGATTDLEAGLPRRLPHRGMVVCEHPLAGEVGRDVLERGGNAADAAVATALALAVVFPQAGSLGGGGFAVFAPHSGEPRALDFRELAPAAASPELYVDAQGRPAAEQVRSGVLSVAVPGVPAGLLELHRALGSGRFTFEELCRPAIRLARDGFEVDAMLARRLREPDVRERLLQSPGARALFLPDGEPLCTGDRLVQDELAATLVGLARRGRTGFYGGPAARSISTELAAGALDHGLAEWITEADLAAYKARWREPLRGWFRGQEIITMPPPSAGGVVLLQVLAVLDGFPLDLERLAGRDAVAAAGDEGVDHAVEAEESGLGARAVHWWIEALRRSFAERAAHIGDPDFHDVPMDRLLSPGWVAHTRMSIGESSEAQPALEPVREGTNTTHLSVLDLQGNAVSLTTTLNSWFGSGILARGTGVFLNNGMDDFSLSGAVPNQFGLVGSEANAVRPGARPVSSMTPTVLREGGRTVSMVLGSPGGPKIPTAVISVCLRTLVYEQQLEEAVAAPRFHQQWVPSATEFEAGWPPHLLGALRRRGHQVVETDGLFGAVQAIRVYPNGEVVGVSDGRRSGAAMGTRAGE